LALLSGAGIGEELGGRPFAGGGGGGDWGVRKNEAVLVGGDEGGAQGVAHAGRPVDGRNVRHSDDDGDGEGCCLGGRRRGRHIRKPGSRGQMWASRGSGGSSGAKAPVDGRAGDGVSGVGTLEAAGMHADATPEIRFRPRPGSGAWGPARRRVLPRGAPRLPAGVQRWKPPPLSTGHWTVMIHPPTPGSPPSMGFRSASPVDSLHPPTIFEHGLRGVRSPSPDFKMPLSRCSWRSELGKRVHSRSSPQNASIQQSRCDIHTPVYQLMVQVQGPAKFRPLCYPRSVDPRITTKIRSPWKGRLQ